MFTNESSKVADNSIVQKNKCGEAHDPGAETLSLETFPTEGQEMNWIILLQCSLAWQRAASQSPGPLK